MRRDFKLENGIICKGEYNNFKLYYDSNLINDDVDNELTPSCNNITYIPQTLIAVKSNKTVYVYKPNVIFDIETPMLIKIATFEVFDVFAYMKIKLNGKVYIIDSNVQISFCECAKMY